MQDLLRQIGNVRITRFTIAVMVVCWFWYRLYGVSMFTFLGSCAINAWIYNWERTVRRREEQMDSKLKALQELYGVPRNPEKILEGDIHAKLDALIRRTEHLREPLDRWPEDCQVRPWPEDC